MDRGALKVAKRILRLNRRPYAFGGIHPDWKNWKVVFGWIAETDFENIALAMNFIQLGQLDTDTPSSQSHLAPGQLAFGLRNLHNEDTAAFPYPGT